MNYQTQEARKRLTMPIRDLVFALALAALAVIASLTSPTALADGASHCCLTEGSTPTPIEARTP